MTTEHTLMARVARLVDAAAGQQDPEAAARVAAIADRLGEPVRIAVAGKVKAGKSTLLNALVGEQLAPTNATECTRVVTWYRDGHTYRVTGHAHDGSSRQLRFHRDDGAIEVDLGGYGVEDLDRLEVTWPSRRLSEMTLIDTPGIESLSTEVSARSHRFLIADEDGPTQADAVVYLMRHMHGTDLRFLEAFHQGDLAHAAPLNAIGVLSRADEVGACRPDAMQSAYRIAARYSLDPQLRPLCQTVLPVAGLVAEAGCMLTEHEFRNLARLAAEPREQADAMLLTADRFLAEDAESVLVPIERQELMDRLGLFGIRLSHALLRVGKASTSVELAAELSHKSGIVALRQALLSQLAGRSDALKAKSAIHALEAVLRRWRTDDGDRLLAQLEDLTAQTHIFQEMRVLDALRKGAVGVREEEFAELERLLGAAGTTPPERLGLAGEVAVGELRQTALDAHARWQRRAEHPMSSRAVVDVSRVATRTCESLVTDLTPSIRPIGR
jgi:predicted GTPase